MTDSGGFQAYSLIRQNPRAGSLSDQGIRFQPEGCRPASSSRPKRAFSFSCLRRRYPGLPGRLHACRRCALEQQISVLRTIKWARRCKEEFQRLLRQHRSGSTSELPRARCCSRWCRAAAPSSCAGSAPRRCWRSASTAMATAAGRSMRRASCCTRCWAIPLGDPARVPDARAGRRPPRQRGDCHGLGYQMFDSALPTRDARSGRLYAFTNRPSRCQFPSARQLVGIYLRRGQEAHQGQSPDLGLLRLPYLPTLFARLSAPFAENERYCCTIAWRRSITCAL